MLRSNLKLEKLVILSQADAFFCFGLQTFPLAGVFGLAPARREGHGETQTIITATAPPPPSLQYALGNGYKTRYPKFRLLLHLARIDDFNLAIHLYNQLMFLIHHVGKTERVRLSLRLFNGPCTRLPQHGVIGMTSEGRWFPPKRNNSAVNSRHSRTTQARRILSSKASRRAKLPCVSSRL